MFVDYRAFDDFGKSELLVAMKYDNASIREAAMLQLKGRFPGELAPQDIQDVSHELLHSDRRNCKAAAELLAANLPGGQAALVSALRSPQDRPALCAAGVLLGASTGADVAIKREAATRLWRCLKRCGADDQNLAVNFMLNIRDRTAVEWLESALQDASISTADLQSTAYAWSLMATEADVEFARKLARGPSPALHESAFAVLSKYSPRDTYDELAIRARDPDAIRRQSAFMQIARAGDERFAEILIKGLSDKDEAIVAYSVDGVAAIKARRALPILVSIIRRGERGRRDLTPNEMAAGNAIATITGEQFRFSRGVGRCGTPDLTAGTEIQRGREIGGKRGEALIKEGEEMLAGLAASDKAEAEEARLKSLSERTRLLDWWDHAGKSQFRQPQHP